MSDKQENIKILEGLDDILNEVENMISRHMKYLEETKPDRSDFIEEYKIFCIFNDGSIELESTRNIMRDACNMGIDFYMLHRAELEEQNPLNVIKYCSSHELTDNFRNLRLLATPNEVILIYSPLEYDSRGNKIRTGITAMWVRDTAYSTTFRDIARTFMDSRCD